MGDGLGDREQAVGLNTTTTAAGLRPGTAPGWVDSLLRVGRVAAATVPSSALKDSSRSVPRSRGVGIPDGRRYRPAI